MKTVQLGSQGLTVSAEGLGCMAMSTTYGPADEGEGIATIGRARELGISLFDTAEVYGPFDNERLVGKALAGERDEVAISTKVGFAIGEDGTLEVVDGRPRLDGSPDHIVDAVHGSLRRLGTDHVDLCYMHRVDPAVPVEESVGALAELVTQGSVGHIGLSEVSAETIRRAHAVYPLTAVQTEYSLFERGVERNEVLATVRELGIGFIAYSPLGRGFLTGALKDLEKLDESDFRRADPRLQGENLAANLRLVEAVEKIAAAKGVEPSQLALAWVIDQGALPIPGSRRIRHLEENAAAVEVELTDADRAALEAAAPVGAAAGERYSAGNMDLIDG